MSIFRNPFKREVATPQPTQAARGGKFADQTAWVNGQAGALGVAAWHRGLAVKADTYAQLVLEYQRRNTSAHGGNYEPYLRAEGRTINYLLQVRPNPYMSASQMLRQMVIQRETQGNAVIWVERDLAGDVKALWLAKAAALNLTNMEYTLTLCMPSLVMKTVPQEDVIHWRNTYSLDGGLTGVGTITWAAGALTLAATNDAQATAIAAKGGKYKILLKEEQRPEFALNLLNKDQRKSQQDELQDALNNGLDVIAMSGLMDAQIISQDAQAQQLLESRKLDVTQICRYLGVPMALVYDSSNNTYKAPEQAMQDFRQYTIAPMMRDVETEMNAKLLGQESFPMLRYHFNDSALMRLDPRGRMDIAKLQLETGIRCVNELRALYDLPAIENGDTHYVSTNLAEVGSEKLRSGSSTPTPELKPSATNGEEGGEQ